VPEDGGRAVALKTLAAVSEAHLASIRREIHTLARLQHPGVVRIVDSGVDGSSPWYAMELIEGPTLGRQCEALRQQGLDGRRLQPWALHEMLTLARQLCSALAYLHGEGVVHRDLKPENVLVTGYGVSGIG
jgi:serine/threonine protein kinase